MTAEQLNAERMIAALVAEEEREGGSPDEAALVCADAIQEAGDDARAELMRVQVELQPIRHVVCYGENLQRKVWLENREAKILTANESRWRNVGVCPQCEGTGDARKMNLSHSFERCQECCGTGSGGGLFKAFGYSSATKASFERVRIRWVRGLPYAVEVPRLTDVLEQCCGLCNGTGTYGQAKPPSRGPSQCPRCRGEKGPAAQYVNSWRQTPWAAAVARHHPTVRAFVVGDREPYFNGYGYSWFNRDRSAASGAVTENSNIENCIFELMSKEVPDGVVDFGGGLRKVRHRVDGRFVCDPTRDGAIDWLARAIMKLVRKSL
jgi:uncharacterized protein (TIGR02996 family)